MKRTLRTLLRAYSLLILISTFVFSSMLHAAPRTSYQQLPNPVVIPRINERIEQFLANFYGRPVDNQDKLNLGQLVLVKRSPLIGEPAHVWTFGWIENLDELNQVSIDITS